MKELSIVVAAQNAQTTIEDCLDSLTRQDQSDLAEIIVVDNSSDRTAEVVLERFKDVNLIKVNEPALIPELWACGANQSTGQVIAFTTAHFIPDGRWISEILSHHRSDHAGVGGAIDNRQPSSLSQWAVYFCRYAAYMLPLPAHSASQIAGDNAAYKRFIFQRYASLMHNGFWEHTINARLRADGYSLWLSPAILVHYAHSPQVHEFCRQRMLHGRIFGAERAATMPGKRRVLYVLASPLTPFILLGKIARQVTSRKRHLREFLLSTPLIALFVLSWSYGEFLGHILGDQRNRR